MERKEGGEGAVNELGAIISLKGFNGGAKLCVLCALGRKKR